MTKIKGCLIDLKIQSEQLIKLEKQLETLDYEPGYRDKIIINIIKLKKSIDTILDKYSNERLFADILDK